MDKLFEFGSLCECFYLEGLGVFSLVFAGRESFDGLQCEHSDLVDGEHGGYDLEGGQIFGDELIDVEGELIVFEGVG